MHTRHNILTVETVYTINILNLGHLKHPKIETVYLYNAIIHLQDADEIAYSVGPDQTAPVGSA